MDPLIGAALLKMGGGFLSNLMGPSDQENANLAATEQGTANSLNEMNFRNKNRATAGANFDQAKKRFLGKDMFNPTKGKNFVMDALRPELQQQAGQYNQQLGNITSGVAQKGLADSLLSKLGGFYAQGERQNAIQSSNRDLSILMGNPYGRI